MATPTSQSTQDLTRDWLVLHHAAGIGGRTLRLLLEAFPDPSAIRAADNTQLHAAGLSKPAIEALRQTDPPSVARDLEWLQQPDCHVLTWQHPHYPPLLAQLPDPPPLLYVHGDITLLSEPQLAMVGSRNPTASGRQTATDFARHLAASGLVVTSGLALGIDTASHQGALDAGTPTIAVMGTGLDRVYPASNRDLARRIAERGALVSEFPICTPPLAENFPRRNRIISGLSLGTLVVEAALRSGSLISARLAAEQGREVFAIPGSIHNPLARGCHHLIRQGAKLVETAQDIIDELGPMAGACQPVRIDIDTDTDMPRDEPGQLAEEYVQLLENMGFDPSPIDRLVTMSGLTPAEVSSMLLQLEMDGYVASNPGGIYNRLK
jgi:DNA processing protein